MATKTGIAWTDATWNPVRGCERVSEGCRRCYAEILAARHSYPGGWGEGLAKWITRKDGTKEARWTGVLQTVESLLDAPLRWRKPRRIFVNSMSDIFHDDVAFEFVDRMFAVMASTARHCYQILTKRPERMLQYMQRVAEGAPMAGQRYEREMREHFDRYKLDFLEGYSIPSPPTPELRFIYDSATMQEKRPRSPDGTTLKHGFSGGEFHWRGWPLSNVWLGVSAEDQDTFDERITLLLQTPAAVRWVSLEPLLGHIDLIGKDEQNSALHTYNNRPRLDWGVVGAESGSDFRQMDMEAARYIIRQFQDAGVPLFVKQDNGPRPGLQGRFTAEEWALKEYPA